MALKYTGVGASCAVCLLTGPKAQIQPLLSKEKDEFLLLVEHEFEGVACEEVIPGVLWAVWRTQAGVFDATYDYEGLALKELKLGPNRNSHELANWSPAQLGAFAHCLSVTTSLQKTQEQLLKKAGWKPIVKWDREKGAYSAARTLTLWLWTPEEKEEVKLAA